MLPRDSSAASEIPSTVSMNSSGEPKFSTSGRASGIDSVSPTAPSRPPAIEARKAMASARAPCPRLAISWPSSMSTVADAEPGMPMSTEEIVSEVCTTATAPMMRASAWCGSMMKTNGSRMATAPVPPSPGMMPMTRPASTPATRKARVVGSSRAPSALSAASSMAGVLYGKTGAVAPRR